jgi:non-specific serine/threonine protein kinase
MLPPQALLKRLEQRLPLLAGGARTLPARQQTMRNTIAWSHDFLTPEEQTIFRRLAVFPGGCTLEAAEAVVNVDGRLDVFGGMAALVDKSLLRQEEGTTGDPRFRMLETVREFGQERLEASSEKDETRRRLADWCLSLAEEAQPEVPGGTVPSHWIARLHQELPNLRDAITWLLNHGEATKALRLLAATDDYWTQQHLSNAELHGWLETALTHASDAPAADRVLAHFLLTLMNGTSARHEDAGSHAEQALIAAQESENPNLLGLAHYAVGLTWEFRGDLGQAAAAFTEAIPLLRAGGFESYAWSVEADLADKLVLQGDLASGVPMLDAALTQLRQIGSAWPAVIGIGFRGYAALWQGDLPGAARWFREAVEVAQSIQQMRTLLSAVTGLAGVALALDKAEQAARILGAVEAGQEAQGLPRIFNAHHVERVVAGTQAALEAAVYERAWSAGRLLKLDEAVSEALGVADEVLMPSTRQPAGESSSV